MTRKKRLIALIMAGVVCISSAGCGRESKKKEKVNQYNAVQQNVIEHFAGKMTVLNDALYGLYRDYNEETQETTVGLFKYDFASQKVTEQDIANDSNLSLDIMYSNAEGQLVLSGTKYLDNGSNKEGETFESETNTDTYTDIRLVYDTDLNRIFIEESVPISEVIHKEIIDSELECGRVETSNGTTVSLYFSNVENAYSIKATDSNGSEKFSFKLENTANGIYCLDGKKVLCDISEDDNQFLYEVDITNGKLGKQIIEMSKYMVYEMYTGANDKMMFISGTNLFECDCNTGKVKKILNFIDSDINPNNVKYIFTLSDGTIGVAVGNNTDTQLEIDYLYKKDKDDKAKKELTIGVLTMDSKLQEDITQYNKTHNDVRLIAKEYYSENGYENGIMELNLDIASGNCPDIISFGSSMVSLQEYVEKGILEELTPYFDKDEELNIDDFIQSVVETYKVNGKLYALPDSFGITGFIGATSVVGQNVNWTLDEFLEFAKSFPNGKEVIANPTKESVLEMLCSCNMNKYVNWLTGECTFDNGDFAKILEFSNTFKTYEDYWKEEQYDEFSDITKIRNKQQILYQKTLYDVEGFMRAKTIYGEDISFKGYPASEGNGVIAETLAVNMCAISSQSKYKNEAWEFIRQYYLPSQESDSQEDFRVGFPIRQDELDEMLETSKIPETYTDENGNEQIFYHSLVYEDIILDISYPTDEDIENIKNIINSIDTIGGRNSMIEEIINEEVAAYYNGQKSAEEVAEIVQGRVSVYVKENR